MHAIAHSIAPLPPVLASSKTANHPNRRRQVGSFRLSTLDLDRFNHVLSTLAGTRTVLGCDQIASAARLLAHSGDCDSTPDCIRQRLEQADTLARMLTDRNWKPANEALAPAGTVLDYLNGHDDLIPDWIPRVGRLDDAIVVETAWPRLSGEVSCYQDFCRLRDVEAALHQRPADSFRFDRNDWEAARRAEAALREHQRRVRGTSYLPSTGALFRIH